MTITLNSLREMDSYSVPRIKATLKEYKPRTLLEAYETILPHKNNFPRIYRILNEVLG